MSLKLKNIVIVGFTHKIGGGGGNLHIEKLISFWESSGNRVTLLDPGRIKEFTLKSVLISTFHSILFKIETIQEENTIDIIVSESPYPPDVILAFRLSRKYLKPMTIYFHHITPDITIFPFRRGIFRVLINVLYTSIILYIVKKFRIPIFLDNPKTIKSTEISVFPDLDAITDRGLNFAPFETRSEFDYDICYIGRIENHKGLEDIIKVARILKNIDSMNFKIILAGKGKGKYINKINKMIERFKLSENITLSGYVSEDKKFELLRRSRIFLFLSYEEGWSISVMEAASVGTPIVAYSLPAYYYLRGNYFSVPLGDIRACAEKLKQVLSDSKLSNNKAIKAKKCVEVFSYAFIAKQQLLFYSKIAKDFLDNNKRV